MCLIAGPGRIPKLWQSSNFECVTHRPPRQNSLFESRRKDLRLQRKGGGVYWVAVLSLPLDSRGVTGCFFANGRHRPLWVSFVSRRGWTGEPRTGTGKQEVEDLVILWGQARTDMEARQCLEGPKNVLPCGQQQAGSQEPGKSKVRPWPTPWEMGQASAAPAECITESAGSGARLDWTPSSGLLGLGMQRWLQMLGRKAFVVPIANRRDLGCWIWSSVTDGGTVVPQTAHHATFLHSPWPGSQSPGVLCGLSNKTRTDREVCKPSDSSQPGLWKAAR